MSRPTARLRGLCIAPSKPWVTQMRPLRLLWATRVAPYPPNYGGDILYTRRLIESVAAAGALVTVLCQVGPDEPPPEITGVAWRALDQHQANSLMTLVGRWPAITARYSSGHARAALLSELAKGEYDAVLIDTLGMAGLATHPRGLSALPLHPPCVYIAHNHEASVRADLGRAAGWGPKGLALRLDAHRTYKTEQMLVATAQLVTTITAADQDRFRQAYPGVEIVVIPPGYDGPRNGASEIDATTPRRVLLLGSYRWIAKQLNLTAFLRAAAPILNEAAIEIQVVGAMPSQVAERLSRSYPTVQFVGAVTDIGPYLRSSRIGVVAEGIGGGFKLKTLDYVFNQLPIAALAGSTSGLPMRPGEGILEFPDAKQLAKGIVAHIDNLPLLNAIQSSAFHSCVGEFLWSASAERLLTAIGQLRQRGARA